LWPSASASSPCSPEQRADLCESVLDLVDDYALGAKRPKVYYQFKMYNDPRLNPELYTRKAGA